MSPSAVSTVLLLLFLIFVDEASLNPHMHENSYDDDYNGCQGEREKEIRERYLNYELSKNKNLSSGWNESIKHWHSRNRSGLDNYTALAVRAYTTNKFYSELNNAVQSGVDSVTKKYYRSMHFLLTKAIQTLKGRNCIRVYRGVKVEIRPKVKDAFRFGRFASTSTNITVARRFGKGTFFSIKTCHGADISKYSVYQNESEVLIPPYEEFIVTQVKGKDVTLASKKVTVYKRCAPLPEPRKTLAFMKGYAQRRSAGLTWKRARPIARAKSKVPAKGKVNAFLHFSNSNRLI
ncbi:ecto-ADP-ribosyltransferase 5-like isoform X1 [Polypterus senegalus]|uniref:ecto-ADP-ribosyltransferase 5-like isoform X1 n=1 Tax=Polypterus senegalus TaxID=55291 RepID=UPI001964B14A|nr:ecto-ADP-ribosyltransferase 5-like isoform X1 [Polypterus senegalus]